MIQGKQLQFANRGRILQMETFYIQKGGMWNSMLDVS